MTETLPIMNNMSFLYPFNFRQHSGTGGDSINIRRQAKSEVEDAFPGISFIPDWVFVVTWYRVACYTGCVVVSASVMCTK